MMAIAGALTIGSPLQSYILAMCHYPEWQVKIREEVEQVCGGRCPEWEDRQNLPTLRAVVKEIVRWRPPVPTGIPHRLEKDDIYNGYFIPAGATIHALEWYFLLFLLPS
jgi:cytochrome P450